MTTLPVDSILPRLRQAMSQHAHCLLVAQPGAGKTTRVPLALLQDTPPGQRWLLLEPRRVAARLAAAYMADQLNENVGETIGYRVRGESRTGKRTRVEVLTQGILTRMLQDDPSLPGVAGLIFDEFHERSLDADLSLALALDAQSGLREDLKILIMSATLDTDALLDVLAPDTPVIDCPGRTWPVSTFYRATPLREPPEQHQVSVIREALLQHDGHVLVFLPGQREIRRVQQALAQTVPDSIDICPLHGQLSLAQQQTVLKPAPTDKRRVILSTSIAESSLTVPGVRIVVDSGRERAPVYQPRSGLTRLETRLVNRASADQRRGRAGREAAGFCYRLWSEETPLAPHREAEIIQSDLSALVFELARWGVTSPASLRWVTPPPAAAIASGRQLLTDLSLLQSQNDGQLSAQGHRCAVWPTHPRLARLLDTASESGNADLCSLACWLVAWLEEQAGSQHIDVLDSLHRLPDARSQGTSRRWWQAARQWSQKLRCPLNADSSRIDAVSLARLLLSAWPDRVAVNQCGGQFKLLSGGQAALPADHRLAKAPLIIAVELDGQAGSARIFSAVCLPEDVLQQAYPATADWQTHAYWDDRNDKLVAEENRRFVLGDHHLVIARRASCSPLKALPSAEIKQALLHALRTRGRLTLDDADLQLLGRLRLLHNVLGSPWPAVSDMDLLDTADTWLAPHLDGLHRLDQIDRLPLGQLFFQHLDWQLQRQLDALAPTHIKVPSGSNIRIDYSTDEPVLAVKLQEMFGQTTTPCLVDGKVPLLIQLLSPARRPVQVTRDLAGFWASSYFDVRKDLRGRYPRHPWPENPLQAQATARAKPRGS